MCKLYFLSFSNTFNEVYIWNNSGSSEYSYYLLINQGKYDICFKKTSWKILASSRIYFIYIYLKDNRTLIYPDRCFLRNPPIYQ